MPGHIQMESDQENFPSPLELGIESSSGIATVDIMLFAATALAIRFVKP